MHMLTFILALKYVFVLFSLKANLPTYSPIKLIIFLISYKWPLKISFIFACVAPSQCQINLYSKFNSKVGLLKTQCCTMFNCSVMADSLQPRGLQPAGLLCPWELSSQEYWGGLPCPPPGYLPNPGIEPRSPTLQVDSLPSEPPGKPKNIKMGSLSLLQGYFLTQESNRGILHCRRILYQPTCGGSPKT